MSSQKGEEGCTLPSPPSQTLARYIFSGHLHLLPTYSQGETQRQKDTGTQTHRDTKTQGHKDRGTQRHKDTGAHQNRYQDKHQELQIQRQTQRLEANIEKEWT